MRGTSRFGSALQILPFDIGKYFSSFFILAVVVVFLCSFLLLKTVFFISVNSYVKKKLTLSFYFVTFSEGA